MCECEPSECACAFSLTYEHKYKYNILFVNHKNFFSFYLFFIVRKSQKEGLRDDENR